jgi:hypothetical protein
MLEHMTFGGLTLSPCCRGTQNRGQLSDRKSEVQICVWGPLGLSGALRMRVAAEGPAALTRLS